MAERSTLTTAAKKRSGTILDLIIREIAGQVCVVSASFRYLNSRSIDRSIDWLIDWSLYSSIHSFFDWLIDWLIDCVMFRRCPTREITSESTSTFAADCALRLICRTNLILKSSDLTFSRIRIAPWWRVRKRIYSRRSSGSNLTERWVQRLHWKQKEMWNIFYPFITFF